MISKRTRGDVARELGRPRAETEAGLCADVMEFRPLREFVGHPDLAALLSRYNVAQLQAALYRAASMTVEATDDFRTILRCAKLACGTVRAEEARRSQGYREAVSFNSISPSACSVRCVRLGASGLLLAGTSLASNLPR